MKITNNTRESLSFIVNGSPKNGHPPTASVDPGETEDLDVVENAHFRGYVRSGAITVPSRAAQKIAEQGSSAPAVSKGKS